MDSDNIIFEEFENSGTVGQLCRFSVSGRRYIAMFACDSALQEVFVGQFDIPAQTMQEKSCYNIKFFGEDHWEALKKKENVDLYATPNDGIAFTPQDIRRLERQLLFIIGMHNRRYKPDIYYFIPETKPLARMYIRMYNKQEGIVTQFKSIYLDHTEFFIFERHTGVHDEPD